MAELRPIIVFHGRHFVRHLGICNRIYINLLQQVCAVITRNSVEKNEVSILINKLQPVTGFNSRHIVRHLEICNPICVKLLQVMSGVIPCNLKKNDFSFSNRFPGVHKRGIHTHTHTHTQTHTHTHDDSIRRNAMRCISPKNEQTGRHTTINTVKQTGSDATGDICLGRFVVKVLICARRRLSFAVRRRMTNVQTIVRYNAVRRAAV